MSVYVVSESEPWAALAERRRALGVEQSAQDQVRRPVRGLQIEKDTYAYFKVVDANGQEIPFIDSGAMSEDADGIGHSTAYSNLLLQKVQISRAELKQFVKTFGLTYLFLFGENPIMLSVEAGLVHSDDFRWDEEWWVNYENTLRATRLAEQGARAYLCYEGILIEGYILDAVTSRDAMVRHLVPLAFEMVATNIKFLAKVGSTKFPVRSTVFTAESPASFGGQDINKILPIGGYLQAGDLNSANLLSSFNSPASASATSFNTALNFGSFKSLFTAIASNPSLLVGIAGSPLATAALNHFQSHPRPLPLPRYGKINWNTDEYVAKAGITITQASPSGGAEHSQVTEFQEHIQPGQERQLAGDAARSVTTPSVLPNGNPTAPGSFGDPNLSTYDGLGGSHGTAVDPTRDLDPSAVAPITHRYDVPY